MLKLLSSIVLGACISTAYASQTQANIIVFGDSLSDTGNNTWAQATGAPLTSFDAKGNKFVWVNYLVNKLFNQPAYASQSAQLHNPQTDSVSYAFASADSSHNFLAADWPEKTPMPPINAQCTKSGMMRNSDGTVASTCVPGLLRQVESYLEDVHQQPNSSTKFIICVGANDLFYKLPTGETPQKIISDAITNIVIAKNKLLAKGVSPQQIYVMNLPDLSKTPYAIKLSLKLTELTLAFNNALQAALTSGNENNPALPITHIISMFNFMEEITQFPDKYNLTNVTESCIDNGKVPLCKGYMFFDSKHGTAEVNRHVADFIYATLKNDL